MTKEKDRYVSAKIEANQKEENVIYNGTTNRQRMVVENLNNGTIKITISDMLSIEYRNTIIIPILTFDSIYARLHDMDDNLYQAGVRYDR